MPDTTQPTVTCHIEDRGTDCRIVMHDGQSALYAVSLDDAYLLARTNGYSVSYVRTMAPVDPLVVLR